MRFTEKSLRISLIRFISHYAVRPSCSSLKSVITLNTFFKGKSYKLIKVNQSYWQDNGNYCIFGNVLEIVFLNQNKTNAICLLSEYRYREGYLHFAGNLYSTFFHVPYDQLRNAIRNRKDILLSGKNVLCRCA